MRSRKGVPNPDTVHTLSKQNAVVEITQRRHIIINPEELKSNLNHTYQSLSSHITDESVLKGREPR